MTEAGWTRDRPQVAGWYWWRSLNGMIGPEIIQIDNTNGPDTDLEVIGPFGETPLDEWIAESEDEPGEWQGPLSPDSYQQGRAAGIGECKDLVDSFAEAYLLASMVAHSLSPESHKGIAEFVSSIGGEIAKLAQQAQEGGVHEE